VTVIAAKVERILSALTDVIGAPKHDVSGDPVSEVVRTILSQNTTSANSSKAYEALRMAFPTWSDIRDADRELLVDTIRRAGLAGTKAATIQRVLSALPTPAGQPSLDVLNDMDDDDATAHLVAFNGVGVKTAACVLVFALGRDICPVDTHVHRVANRLGLVKTKDRDKTYSVLKAVIPAGRSYDAHVLLVRFGRMTCKARSPLCHACPAFDDCAFEERHDHAARAVGQAAT
jgi:endonuclease III